MTTIKTVPQILNDAADILEAEGAWTQGDWHTACETAPDGVSHCADGALERASGVTTNFRINPEGWLDWDYLDNEEEDVYQSYIAAREAASNYTVGIADRRLVAYNDQDDRTQDEVVAALRAAARQASELVPA